MIIRNTCIRCYQNHVSRNINFSHLLFHCFTLSCKNTWRLHYSPQKESTCKSKTVASDLSILLPGPYLEQISYRLTGMGAQKNAPKKQKVKLLGLTCLFIKRKFNETHKTSILTTPTTANMERQFSVLTFLSTKLWNTLASNSLDKLMQVIPMEPHIYD